MSAYAAAVAGAEGGHVGDADAVALDDGDVVFAVDDAGADGGGVGLPVGEGYSLLRLVALSAWQSASGPVAGASPSQDCHCQ